MCRWTGRGSMRAPTTVRPPMRTRACCACMHARVRRIDLLCAGQWGHAERLGLTQALSPAALIGPHAAASLAGASLPASGYWVPGCSGASFTWGTAGQGVCLRAPCAARTRSDRCARARAPMQRRRAGGEGVLPAQAALALQQYESALSAAQAQMECPGPDLAFVKAVMGQADRVVVVLDPRGLVLTRAW
jgi:hypothetical protein